MNAKRLLNIFEVLLIIFVPAQVAFSDSVQQIVGDGNKLYSKGNFSEAIKKYDQALIESPEALEPKYNKANSFYRLDDLFEAMDLYQEIAAESKDMRLVAKSKYNLGNCYFQRGSKQRDSNLQKSLEDLKTSINCWRQVLDIEPDNEKAAKNIEVARLIIKDIIDQLNKQKQEQQQQEGQQGQQEEQQNTQGQQQQQQQKGLGQDPNQPQEPNQPNEQQQDTQEQQQVKQQKAFAPDATAQEILDKEQRQKEQRQILQRARYQKVDKDW